MRLTPKVQSNVLSNKHPNNDSCLGLLSSCHKVVINIGLSTSIITFPCFFLLLPVPAAPGFEPSNSGLSVHSSTTVLQTLAFEPEGRMSFALFALLVNIRLGWKGKV
jgi:hypothetical protein